MVEGTIERMYQAIVEANLVEADRCVDEAAEKVGHELVLSELLTPLLDRIDRCDDLKMLNLAQGYVTSKIVKRILAECDRTVPSAGTSSARDVVVLCNAQDDCHPLGRLIVASILRGHGWEVVDLGIDVEATRLVDEAERLNAKVVGVSAMTYTTARNAGKVREEISCRGLDAKLKLAVGGVAFRLDPALVGEVGADGTAANAWLCPQLFRKLQKDASEGRPCHGR